MKILTFLLFPLFLSAQETKIYATDFAGLSATATLNFSNTLGGGKEDLTISVTGAAAGDPVVLGVPIAAMATDGVFIAWVSATDVVTVRFANNSGTAIDPASGSFKVFVLK